MRDSSDGESSIPPAKLAKPAQYSSSDDEDNLPLARLAEQIQDEKVATSKRCLESPLPESKRACETLDSDDDVCEDQYVPVKRDRESDSDNDCPPDKVLAEDSDSEISDLDVNNVNTASNIKTDCVDMNKSTMSTEQKMEVFTRMAAMLLK